MDIGFAMCGSFCTYTSIFPIMELLTRDYSVTPILSYTAASTDTRFGFAKNNIHQITEICGRPPLTQLTEVEPIGPKKLFDALIIAPCTGNTLAKLSHSISDTPVTMAAKSHLRNGRPVLIAISTNDGLSNSAENIGRLLSKKNIYFVPFRQDDPFEKPYSVIADFTLIPKSVEMAINGIQIQPILI